MHNKPIIILLILFLYPAVCATQNPFQDDPTFLYTISFPETEFHRYHVDFSISGLSKDTVVLILPQWMPGYYQIMNYAGDLEHISAKGAGGKDIPLAGIADNRWQLSGIAGQDVVISYEIATHRRFVANSYCDSSFAYILPANTFLYVQGCINDPAEVKIIPRNGWDQIATGLSARPGTKDVFYAPGYDILLDCPILTGDLEEFPPFEVEGIKHRFLAYDPGELNGEQLMRDLQRIVQVAADMMGEVPYDQYTFIGLGKGLGGIEHLNNTTISFHGSSLATPESRQRVLSFIAHEYFHHYNAKRIRPIELGPFDYERENRTGQSQFTKREASSECYWTFRSGMPH